MRTCSTNRSCGHLSGTGAVRELERKLARWYGLPHALAVSNATSGLMGIALALDLAGTEFVTTPYTWGGSLAPWLALGCRPVFADIDPRTLTLDPRSVVARITARTRAILAVDIDGTPCDSVALREIADDHGLWYIADAAQSLGATIGGRPASANADALVVSFGTGKLVDVGEGGAVVTPHTWLHRRLIWHTQHPHRQARDLGLALTNELAINARIHPTAALEADVRFDDALTELPARQDRCFAILRLLEGSGLIEPVDMPGPSGRCPSFYRLSVAVRRGCTRDVNARLEEWLNAAGFPARVEDSPVKIVYRLPGFPKLEEPPTPCPDAELQRVHRRVIRL
jgi:dTDP-4-amino-4,6-dideoxygalactose transaminase